ncbi:MAG: amino acid adenylation domain-containing protein [Comamonadaceae bacterium]|nr:MAG: amino acid adenylation domain-containing protein [Comamonadaceae bacterium]
MNELGIPAAVTDEATGAPARPAHTGDAAARADDVTLRALATPWPLTQAQAGLWYAQRLDAGNPVFNTAQYTELRGPLDTQAFEAAVNQTMQESTGLAMRVQEVDGAPCGVIDPAFVPRLTIVDCTTQADPVARARAQMDADRHTAVDPARAPLAVQRLFKVGVDHHLWYERVHHLATDGYGMSLIDTRVAQCYGARVTGMDAGQPLGAFEAVLAEDAAYRTSAKHAGDAAFWAALFTDVAPVSGMAEGVPVSAHHFLQAQCVLPDAFAQSLRALDQQAGVSWPDILLALCAAYAARMTGRGDTVVGAPYMGRLGSASARVPAMVMNVLAVPIAIDEDLSLPDFVLATARLLRRTRRHGRYRSEQLRRDLGRLGGQRRLYGPLINVLPFDSSSQWAGLQARLEVLCAGPVDDLTVTFRADPLAQRVALAVDANPALYSQADVDAHLTRLTDFLNQAVCAATLSEVPTLTPSELAVWRSHANGPAQDVPRTTLAALIEQTMQRSPQAPALVFDGQTIDYAELDVRSGRLARALAANGVGRGDIVALGIERSIELVVALVGILRAGAAYLPLDLAHPRERLDTILRAAGPRTVLAVRTTRHRLPWPKPLCVDTLSGDPLAIEPQTALPDDPAYVIYTSGSTGAPKGVVINHDAIVNRLLWMASHYGIGAHDRTLQKTPATFDVSVWEFFLPLITGGVLVVAPPQAHKDPAWLLDIVRAEAITTMHFVPSMLTAFLSEPRTDARSRARGDVLALRRVFCSGEALPAAVRDRFHQVLDADLHNLYGPTEAAVDVSAWEAGATDRSVPVPIGYPVWNTALYVLDERLRPAPVGVVGHLYIAGRQLAQGYLGRADLTDHRFIADPFGKPGSRMYATGDLARRLPDGALVFLGRSDHQIKIRGLRVELEEIEAVMAHAPGVAHVAVIARADQPGQDRIVAYVVAHEHVSVTRDGLRAHAAQRLPDYMVPAAFVVLPSLPVTVNGKLDRQALPVPPSSSGGGRAPVTGTEREIAGFFATVLQTSEPIGADDDFFDLGGHSLLAAQLAAQVRDRWACAFSLGAIFEHPTVSRLAQHLDALTTLPASDGPQASGAGGFGNVLTLRQGPSERAALFCVHPAGGLSWCYGALARALPQRTVYGLQARALHPHASDVPQTVADMARDYVQTVLALQPQGPYHLIGWSVGGIIAQAMAAVLHELGHQVGGLAMLDAYPSDSWRDQPAPPEDAIYKALLHIAGYDPAGLIDLAMTRDGVVDFLRRSGHPLGELPDDMIDGVFRVVAHNNAMVRTHHHTPYPGHLMYFRAALDHEGENLFPRQWSPYVASLDIHDVPAVHAHMVGADATALIAPELGEYLAQRDVLDRAPLTGSNHRHDT